MMWVHHHRGDLADAERCANEVVALGTTHGFSGWIDDGAVVLACLAPGDRAPHGSIRDLSQRLRLGSPGRAVWRNVLCLCALARGAGGAGRRGPGLRDPGRDSRRAPGRVLRPGDPAHPRRAARAPPAAGRRPSSPSAGPSASPGAGASGHSSCEPQRAWPISSRAAAGVTRRARRSRRSTPGSPRGPTPRTCERRAPCSTGSRPDPPGQGRHQNRDDTADLPMNRAESVPRPRAEELAWMFLALFDGLQSEALPHESAQPTITCSCRLGGSQIDFGPQKPGTTVEMPLGKTGTFEVETTRYRPARPGPWA